MTVPSPDAPGPSLLSGQVIDLSHQEMDRLLHALEELYNDSKASTPDLEWMPMTGVGNLLAQELGYEDMDEFEDALGGSFENFLRNLPHIELKADARFTDGLVFKVGVISPIHRLSRDDSHILLSSPPLPNQKNVPTRHALSGWVHG